MVTKKVEVNLSKEIISVMSMFNGKYGAVSHDLAEIEKELETRTVSYDRHELETAIVHLIKDERITIYCYTMGMGSSISEYKIVLRTLC